jgi:FKBP-type peptidyl-prolyl cis-trans isomerase
VNHDTRARLALPSLALLLGLAACTTPAEPAPTNAKADAKAATPDAKSDEKVDQKAQTTPPKRNIEQIAAPADVAAAPADAEKSEAGVACKSLKAGEGDKPTDNDTVKIHYTAWTSDGETVDTTTTRKAPKLVRMAKPPIPGWGDAIKMMQPGEKRLCWIPESLAYMGRKGAPAGQITYEIELVEVLRAPQTPEDVAEPPKDAKKTNSGLAYKVLTQGTGDKHPRKWDRVRVHYSGWTTDGKMFDSSVQRGAPSSFPLDRVIKGWTEGVQLMVAGEKRRFWIPGALAYDNSSRADAPKGMLVFDIELLEIK